MRSVFAEAVVEAFEANPHLSRRPAGLMFGTSVVATSRASKAKGLRPYKLHVCQRCTDDNKVRRLSFCRSKLTRIVADPGHLLFLVLSDEAALHLDRQVNRQCTCFWPKIDRPVFRDPKGRKFPRHHCLVWNMVRGGDREFFFSDTTLPVPPRRCSFWPSLRNTAVSGLHFAAGWSTSPLHH